MLLFSAPEHSLKVRVVQSGSTKHSETEIWLDDAKKKRKEKERVKVWGLGNDLRTDVE